MALIHLILAAMATNCLNSFCGKNSPLALSQARYNARRSDLFFTQLFSAFFLRCTLVTLGRLINLLNTFNRRNLNVICPLLVQYLSN